MHCDRPAWVFARSPLLSSAWLAELMQSRVRGGAPKGRSGRARVGRREGARAIPECWMPANRGRRLVAADVGNVYGCHGSKARLEAIGPQLAWLTSLRGGRPDARISKQLLPEVRLIPDVDHVHRARRARCAFACARSARESSMAGARTRRALWRRADAARFARSGVGCGCAVSAPTRR